MDRNGDNFWKRVLEVRYLSANVKTCKHVKGSQ